MSNEVNALLIQVNLLEASSLLIIMMETSKLKVNKSRLQHKIESQSGASITYALLLFLVCAVVSSVILAAGTAASGRISESVDTDRKYFAVTSAIQLLRSEFEKYEVRVDQTYRKEGNSDPIPDGVPKYWYRKKAGTTGSQDSEWTDYDKRKPDDHIITMSAVYAYSNKTRNEITNPITISFDDAESEYAKALSVDVNEKINSDTGRINLEISSSKVEGDTNDHPYTMVLVFVPNIKVSSREKKTIDADGTEITVTVKQTKIDWNFSSIGAVESSSEAGGSPTGAGES